MMEGPLENRFTTIAVFTDLYIINTATHTDTNWLHLDTQIHFADISVDNRKDFEYSQNRA